MGERAARLDGAALDLPPLIRRVAPPAGVAPFDHARAVAAEAGPGTLVWAEHPRLLRLAVVLEPEGPLRAARRAFFACMAALGDALAAHCPPERLVRFRWPDTVVFDRARLGGARLGWPAGCAEDAEPAWLVWGVSLFLDRGLAEPGRFPESSSLAEEAFDPPRDVVESVARYLMLWADRWAAEGFGAVERSYLDRLEDAAPGARIGADGALRAPGAAPRGLAEGLAAAAWAGPDGEPRP